jgi:hypothetical protein
MTAEMILNMIRNATASAKNTTPGIVLDVILSVTPGIVLNVIVKEILKTDVPLNVVGVVFADPAVSFVMNSGMTISSSKEAIPKGWPPFSHEDGGNFTPSFAGRVFYTDSRQFELITYLLGVQMK